MLRVSGGFEFSSVPVSEGKITIQCSSEKSVQEFVYETRVRNLRICVGI